MAGEGVEREFRGVNEIVTFEFEKGCRFFQEGAPYLLILPVARTIAVLCF